MPCGIQPKTINGRRIITIPETGRVFLQEKVRHLISGLDERFYQEDAEGNLHQLYREIRSTSSLKGIIPTSGHTQGGKIIKKIFYSKFHVFNNGYKPKDSYVDIHDNHEDAIFECREIKDKK
jgi:hypothetical protein